MSIKPMVIALASLFFSYLNSLAGDCETLLVADFGRSVQTHQGGFFRCIGGTPDQVVDQLVTVGQPEKHAWRIDLSSDAPNRGAGALVPLFDESKADKNLISIGSDCFLTGRLLGELGKRRLRFELVPTPAPEAAGRLLGTIEAGELTQNSWQEIRLPITHPPDGSQQAAFIRILAEGEGPSWFAIDSLAIAATDMPEISSPATAHALRKALWFWNTEKTLPSESRTTALLELCRVQGITDLYCQIPYSYHDGEIHLRLTEELRAFNTRAASLGISTHALDGSSEYVLQENHQRMIRLMEALGALNANSSPNERFQGVHLDNEPYTLPGWQNDNERPQIIRDYLTLNKRISQQTKEYGLAYGVDIPFWWDAVDRDGRARFTYDTDAGKQPILEALFPLIDNVGIMSYRDRVTGPNGLVVHCLNEFELGQKFDVQVMASVELGVGDSVESGTTFGVYPWSYFRGQLTTLESILSHTPGCAGIAVHYAKPFAEAVK